MTVSPTHDPLGDLSTQGVAVWLGDLSRELLATGRLQELADTRHVVGVTTNPTIFAAAEQMRAAVANRGRCSRPRRRLLAAPTLLAVTSGN
jgi:transaldolase